MRDQLLVLIIATVIIMLLAFATKLLLNEWLHMGAKPLGPLQRCKITPRCAPRPHVQLALPLLSVTMYQ
jgi:hypothetical protein